MFLDAEYCMNISLNELSPNKVYHLLTQTVIPRPIAWVLTQNKADDVKKKTSFNLAPFSYFTPVASNPPLLMISIGKKSTGVDKDTVTNVKREKMCVVHIASIEQMQVLNASAAELGENESEVDALNVSLCRFDDEVKRIENAPIAFKCKLHECQTLVGGTQTLLFLEVLDVFLDEVVIDKDAKRLSILADQVNPLTRLGAGEYAGLGEVIPLLRP